MDYKKACIQKTEHILELLGWPQDELFQVMEYEGMYLSVSHETSIIDNSKIMAILAFFALIDLRICKISLCYGTHNVFWPSDGVSWRSIGIMLDDIIDKLQKQL